MTAPSAEQLISGQEHGGDEVFHEDSCGGFPHCCLMVRRVVWSAGDCEITRKGMRVKRK